MWILRYIKDGECSRSQKIQEMLEGWTIEYYFLILLISKKIGILSLIHWMSGQARKDRS
jgi:hypothetical protein